MKDFRENWHSEKAKFSAAEIRQGLAWLRENGLTPTGRGTATKPQ